MKNNRRDFLKLTGMAGTSMLTGFAAAPGGQHNFSKISPAADYENLQEGNVSIIGNYGSWASSLHENSLPAFSFRRKEWSDLNTWQEAAKKQLAARMAIPDIGGMPEVHVRKQYTYDGLHVEELSWSLPYGRPTEAILLKPVNTEEPLPGILAFHDHGGNKYFGKRKITQTATTQHPMIATHQQEYYENMAWANEIAKRGYVVLVPDAFTFASRRVMMQDVPEPMRQGLTDEHPEDPAHIQAYNRWASEHEHVMAKSLFSAGTTWPGVFFAEDQKALDILCAREDVDASRVGCGGLSGGGLRTVFMGGLDARIKCAVCIGFMSTWKDFVLHKSFTHTWMTYVPVLPGELDFPEILGLRVPLPTLVLSTENDQLYTLPQMKAADAILKEVYTKAKADHHYKCSFYPGGHKFDKPMQAEAFAWFDKWMKG